jgi:AraC-like DNA-binding protein
MAHPTAIPPAADPLGEVLHLLRLSGCVYARSELSAPWGVALPPLEGHMMLHVVTSGRCWLEIEGQAPLRLERGGLVLVPHGRGHALASDAAAERVPFFDLPIQRLTQRYEFLQHGGGGEECRLICVVVRFDHAVAERLIAALPPVLHLDAWEGGEDRWLADTLGFIAREAEQLRPGGETVITRLADVLVVQMLRHWLGSAAQPEAGWLAALRDEQLGRAIGAIHRDPGAAWSLATLARTAAMSRSSFAARFAQVVGEPAMRYLTRWRLLLARQTLRDGEDTLSHVAERFGYRSEASFCRAFKREFGLSPGQDRRRPPPALGGTP